MPLIQLFVLNSFNKEYQCPLFNAPTVSLPMSDRPIQATPTLTISNNCNAVFHRHRWRCSACSLPKRQDSRLLQAQPSVLWWVVYWLLSVSTAMKNITAMPSSISVWIANKRLHGCRNRISDFTRLHL